MITNLNEFRKFLTNITTLNEVSKDELSTMIVRFNQRPLADKLSLLHHYKRIAEYINPSSNPDFGYKYYVLYLVNIPAIDEDEVSTSMLIEKILDINKNPIVVTAYSQHSNVKDKYSQDVDISNLFESKSNVTYSLKNKINDDVPYKVYAAVDNKNVGELQFVVSKDNSKLIAASVVVDPNYRRQGIATALYKYAEQEMGLKFVKTNTTTKDGDMLWNSFMGEGSNKTLEYIINQFNKLPFNSRAEFLKNTTYCKEIGVYYKFKLYQQQGLKGHGADSFLIETVWDIDPKWEHKDKLTDIYALPFDDERLEKYVTVDLKDLF
jgi:predicted GNAT family acetyltransferase